MTAPRSAIPLTAEDVAILRLESPTIVGHIAKVVALGGAEVPAGVLRQRFADRLSAGPELTYRLAGPADMPCWQPGGVDLDVHIAEVPGPVDAAGLRALIAQRFATHLDRQRPLWAMDVVPLADGGTALVWRLHHALADGLTAVRLIRSVLLDQAPGDPVPASPPPRAPGGSPTQERHRLAGLVERELLSHPGRSPFDGPICDHRDVGLADVSLARLRHAAGAVPGATVNDAMLALVTGALRTWAAGGHGRAHDVRVRIPVSLHVPGDTVGNRDGWFDLTLPVHLDDPRARLAAIRRRTAARKAAGDALELERLDHRLHTEAPRLARLYEAHVASPGSFAVSVSNVPGPREPVSVLGRPVERITAFAELGLRHALRICAFSTGDALAFGLTADPDIVRRVDVLAAALPAALDELTG